MSSGVINHASGSQMNKSGFGDTRRTLNAGMNGATCLLEEVIMVWGCFSGFPVKDNIHTQTVYTIINFLICADRLRRLFPDPACMCPSAHSKVHKE